jgi:tryptophan synthase alpha chain
MTPVDLKTQFARLRERGEKALVLFVTAGDPSLENLPQLLLTLQEAGADVIEVGLPFSDPIADGPTIQASSQRALDRGVTPDLALQALESVKLDIPVVLMGYYNPILRMGVEQFARRARAAGASGTIVSDLIPEESGEWIRISREHGLDTIFLAAPTSTGERIAAICKHTTGFVYAVSRTGVTGAARQLGSDAADLVDRIRACSDLPVCVGFGISSPDHVREVCRVADGAVVGSWLVDLLDREWAGGQGRPRVLEAVQALKAATR